MTRLEPLTPVDTTGLFAPLSAELVALLRGLAESDWSKPTVAGAWSVKDVAGHLLDGQLRRLAYGRDAHTGRGPASGAYGDVVAFINELNATGVAYAARLSQTRATPNGVFGAKLLYRQLLNLESLARQEPELVELSEFDRRKYGNTLLLFYRKMGKD